MNATSVTNDSLGNAGLTTTTTTGYVPWWTGDWKYWFYFIAHSTGGAGLTLLLLTMCLPLRRVRRNPILISMCFSWWIGSFPNLTLLFYTNNVLGDAPSQATCLASAALTMSQTPLNAVCAVTLVYNVWSVLYFTSARSGPSSARTFLLVIIPYVVFLVSAGSVVAVGLIRPETVSRATFYCVVHSDILTIFLGVFGGACCVAAIILEAWIGILLRKNRSRTTPSAKSKSSAGSGMDLQLAVRVVLFGFYIFFGLGLSIISIINWTSVVPDLCFSTFSLAVFFIFGSQQDIIRVWKRGLCCCFVRSEQETRRSASHIRAGSVDSNAKNGISANAGMHSPYWYRHADKKDQKIGDGMADLATLHTRHTIGTQAGTTPSALSPYNSHTDFQFQFESDVGLGLVGKPGQKDNAKGAKKAKDTKWGAGKPSNRPGTGGNSKQQRPGTADSNFGTESQNWYPDLGYAFDPEGTSHTADTDLEMDVATSGPSRPYLQGQNPPLASRGGKGHANEHTRHSSATVPSEYIGTSPRSPQFIYYDNEEAAQSLPQLVSALSPTPLLPKETSGSKAKVTAEVNTYGNSGFQFPVAPQPHAHAHAPTVNSRLYIEHRAGASTDTSASISNANDSRPYLFSTEPENHRESTDIEAGGLPAYYLRQHSHSYMQSSEFPDYRSSADSSIGMGARAAIKAQAQAQTQAYVQPNNAVRGGDPRAGVPGGVAPAPTKLYDSDYPYSYDYEDSNMSTTAMDHSFVPPSKSAFDREGSGFQFISGRKRTAGGSDDSFQTNPSLYGGRAY
ncbi:hypothetical protein M408DRAFT_189973 [Serendipita vermifera MAFF 305830]|uniref:Uncharacterized protein n=1 Tax=Serendipita vermifera MAFF 305830 TaxID=933852 RepID=A0A0C3B824_SERVB|nr:hypothetical protein M408DRAFT_189973 [Serendipita vermifera MAFF 305830]